MFPPDFGAVGSASDCSSAGRVFESHKSDETWAKSLKGPMGCHIINGSGGGIELQLSLGLAIHFHSAPIAQTVEREAVKI